MTILAHNDFPADRLQSSETSSEPTDSDRRQIVAFADGNSQTATSAGFPHFSDLPPELRLTIWEMAALDSKIQPRPLKIVRFGNWRAITTPIIFKRAHHASVLRQVCFDSRRVFDAMAAGVPVVSFHVWPTTLMPSGYWGTYEYGSTCLKNTASFGLFVEPYNVYATSRGPEANQILGLQHTLRADTLYLPLSVLRNAIHRVLGPYARRPTYLLAGDYAYQVPDLDFFFRWKSPPCVALSDDGTVEEVVLEPWPASVNSVTMPVRFGMYTRTEWTAAVRFDYTETEGWKRTAQLPACWGLEFDFSAASELIHWLRLFLWGALRHIVFVIERLPRAAERQGPHDLARFATAEGYRTHSIMQFSGGWTLDTFMKWRTKADTTISGNAPVPGSWLYSKDSRWFPRAPGPT